MSDRNAETETTELRAPTATEQTTELRAPGVDEPTRELRPSGAVAAKASELQTPGEDNSLRNFFLPLLVVSLVVIALMAVLEGTVG
jgi:hypothetical protein